MGCQSSLTWPGSTTAAGKQHNGTNHPLWTQQLGQQGFVDPVLGRDHSGAVGQPRGQPRDEPLVVERLDRDDQHIDRSQKRPLLDVPRGQPSCSLSLRIWAHQAQAVCPDGLHMLGPSIDHADLAHR